MGQSVTPHRAIGAQDRPRSHRQGQPLPQGRARPNGRRSGQNRHLLGRTLPASQQTHAQSQSPRRHHRSILVIIFHLLADPTATFNDLGSDYYAKRLDINRRTRSLVNQLQALGHHVTLTPAA